MNNVLFCNIKNTNIEFLQNPFENWIIKPIIKIMCRFHIPHQYTGIPKYIIATSETCNIASIFNCYFHNAFMLWTMCYFIFLCLFSIGLYPLFLVEWRTFEERKTSFRSCDNIFWYACVLMWNVETTHYFNKRKETTGVRIRQK
jgi:hypothetical protein